jgi:hypothetical protein
MQLSIPQTTEAYRLAQRFRLVLRNDGPMTTAQRAMDKLLVYGSYPYRKSILGETTFSFSGNVYRYFIHHYNATWRNERCVEIALALEKLNQFKGKRILEVGNVTSYYTVTNHSVIDKYETSPGVTNVDVIDYNPATKYDLILSISTIEHVGWDEAPREPGKFLLAFQQLESLLDRGGELFVTVPLGHNPHLDDALISGQVPASSITYLKRPARNQWIEATAGEVAGVRYGHPYPGANAIAVIQYVSAGSAESSRPNETSDEPPADQRFAV